VGKSTLINALLGYSRAIVFDQPGTTRDVVTGETAFDGWPVQLSDTAGIRATGDQLERAGVDRTRQAVRQADLVCLLLDLSEPEDPEDPEERELLEELLDRDSDRVPPCLVIAHKSDLPAVRTPPEPVEPLPVSSVTGTGVDELIGRIVSTLVPEPPPEHRAVPVTGRQVRWLQRARDHLASDEVDKARTALQNCLEGTAFEGA